MKPELAAHMMVICQSIAAMPVKEAVATGDVDFIFSLNRDSGAIFC